MRGWLLVGSVLLGLGVTVGAQSKPAEEFRIDIVGSTIGATGGEQRNVGFSGSQFAIGRTTTAFLSKMPNLCGLNVAGFGPFPANAISGWRVDVTPTKVVDRAITFRLQWVRGWDAGKASTGPSGDSEVTLRPGQSLPLDTIPLSPAVNLPPGCDVHATSLRVSVADEPKPDFDRRLVETDVWLVEYLPDRTERSQKLTVRGLYNQATGFYFDSVDAVYSAPGSAQELKALLTGKPTLDIFGRITPRDGQGVVALEVETLRRVGKKDDPPYETNLGRVTSTLALKPDDVAAVELPKLTGTGSEPFAGRVFSLRVRSRQIR